MTIKFLASFLLRKVVSVKFGFYSPWIVLIVAILNDVVSKYNNIFAAVLGYVFTLFMSVVYYWLFRKYSTKAILMTIFSFLTLNLKMPIFIFAIRDTVEA